MTKDEFQEKSGLDFEELGLRCTWEQFNKELKDLYVDEDEFIIAFADFPDVLTKMFNRLFAKETI